LKPAKAVCLACELTAGERELPGGRVHSTNHWVVEHCVGPLGVGTLLVKPFRHCLHVGDLTDVESAEMGPVLAHAAACVRELAGADQVYVCLWSHAGWAPGHIHFVVQPVQAQLRSQHPVAGPTLQSEMFHSNQAPSRSEVVAFCARARAWFESASTRGANR